MAIGAVHNRGSAHRIAALRAEPMAVAEVVARCDGRHPLAGVWRDVVIVERLLEANLR